jgi:hypothetical protein
MREDVTLPSGTRSWMLYGASRLEEARWIPGEVAVPQSRE